MIRAGIVAQAIAEGLAKFGVEGGSVGCAALVAGLTSGLASFADGLSSAAAEAAKPTASPSDFVELTRRVRDLADSLTSTGRQFDRRLDALASEVVKLGSEVRR